MSDLRFAVSCPQIPRLRRYPIRSGIKRLYLKAFTLVWRKVSAAAASKSCHLPSRRITIKPEQEMAARVRDHYYRSSSVAVPTNQLGNTSPFSNATRRVAGRLLPPSLVAAQLSTLPASRIRIRHQRITRHGFGHVNATGRAHQLHALVSIAAPPHHRYSQTTG